MALLNGTKRSAIKSRGRRVHAGIAGAVLTLALCATGIAVAFAADGAVYPKNIIETTTPAGTTMNLYDYYTNDGKPLSVVGAGGINNYSQLKFNEGDGQGINHDTGEDGMPVSFVQSTLNAQGYPSLKPGSYTVEGTTSTINDDGELDLDYLFNDQEMNGKTSHQNVQDLLAFDASSGYYTYSSQSNYAVYDSSTNAFNVYDGPAVHEEKTDGPLGEFFPFNSASDVFTQTETDGLYTLNAKDVTDDNNAQNVDGSSVTLNHHFGLSMTTKFTQPKDGKVTWGDSTDNMTYEFSGDDDVWVYIDDVLVGDLGGIHDSASLKIDFATGEVKIFNTKLGEDSKGSTSTNLKALFQAALGESFNEADFNGNTFADDTDHELKFFYLERGAYASHLNLKFNLVYQVETNLDKQDDDGNALKGATFELYAAEDDWTDSKENGGAPLATGTTDSDGHLTLTKSDKTTFSFDDEWTKQQTAKYNLYETKVPDGYRSSADSTLKCAHFEYKLSEHTGGVPSDVGVLTAAQVSVDGENYAQQWLGSGLLSVKETIYTESGTLHYYSYSASAQDGKGDECSAADGVTFAVVLHNTKAGKAGSAAKPANWYPVVGTQDSGYDTLPVWGVNGAIAAASDQSNALTATLLPEDGFYTLSVAGLPGDVSKYAFMLSSSEIDNAEFTVQLYHTTADSLAEADEENTHPIWAGDLTHKFSTTMNCTNVKNRLWVSATDAEGNATPGASFSLYKAEDIAIHADGSYSVIDGAAPLDTLTTPGNDSIYGLAGTACFPEDSDKHTPLSAGTYYLVQTAAPDGYQLNNMATKVIVDANGVYADAGYADNGVKTLVSAGSLYASLAQYGLSVGIDNTLTNIKGTLQKGTYEGDPASDGSITWAAADSAQENSASSAEGESATSLKLSLDHSGASEYSPARWYVNTTADKALTESFLQNDEGIARMQVSQDLDTTKAAAKEYVSYTDLGNLELNQVVTNATVVAYANQQYPRLSVSAQVTAEEGITIPEGGKFTFEFAFTPADGDDGKTYTAKVFKTNNQGQEVQVGGDYTLQATFDADNPNEITIEADQTIKVYGLSASDGYTVTELTDADHLSADYSLAKRTQGGQEVTGTDPANAISGTVAESSSEDVPSGNTLAFTNKFTPYNPVQRVTIESGDGGPALNADGQLVGMGTEVTYTIEYANFATDAQGNLAAAPVTISDVIPLGLTYVEGSAGENAAYDEYHRTLTWTFDEVSAGGHGTVSFKVTTDTFGNGLRSNTATVTAAGASRQSNATTFSVPSMSLSGATYQTSAAIGDVLTFQAAFTVPEGATQATITDVVSEGTSYVEGSAKIVSVGDGQPISGNASYDADSNKVSWEVTELSAGSTVTVSFQAKVEPTAFKIKLVSSTQVAGIIDNNALVELDNDYPVASTDTGRTFAELDAFTVRAVNNGGNADDEFCVTVKLADKDGKPVSGTFGQDAGEATFNEQGETTFTLKGEEQKVLQLPEGVNFTVMQAAKAGYTTEYTKFIDDQAKSTTTSPITCNLNPMWHYSVAITNQAVETQPALLDTAGAGMAAGISGRNWASGDSFGFTLAAADDATQAAINSGDIAGANAQGEDQALTTSAQVGGASGGSDALPFNFGKVKFKKAGTYTFKVAQSIPADADKAAGITYDAHALTLRVAVTVNNDNTLSAVCTAGGNTTFENTFRTTVNYSAVAGVEIAKTLNGHAMTAGQFAFTVEPDAAAAKRLGLDSGANAYTATAEDAGDTCVIDLFGGKNVVFGPEDAGTYTFTIAETTAPGAGYTNDSDARSVTIDVSADSSTGVVTVTTTAKKGEEVLGSSTVKSSDAVGSAAQKVTVPFTSSYAATGTLAEGAIDATKTLTGREMADEEFEFAVTNVSDAANKELASGTNAGAKAGVAGKVTFSAISYSTESLEADVKAGLATKSTDAATGNATYTLHYKVAEKTEQVSQAGVTPGASAFAITVTVADNGASTLTPTIAYPEGTTSLAFTNSYSSNSATINLSGTKKLAMDDPSLTRTLKAGEFSFTIASEDGAPLPATTTVTNDAAGNVNFGSVTYTQDSLAGATVDENGIRSKTFTYQVTESGEVAGVVNDKDTQREFSVVVSEDTSKAQITAYLVDSGGNEKASSAFCFTNTYRVSGTQSAATDSIQVSAAIDGRDLKAGEFTFELVEGSTVVATGTNAADGSVSLGAITYTSPGTYSYVLRQAIPADASKLAGVEYDTLSYEVVATVTDNGDGTLSAAHQLVDAQGQPVDDSKALFQNIYEAQPTSVSIGAGVVLNGKDLAAGQFTYTLTDASGSVVATAKNAADGQVSFPELTYSDADMVDADGNAQTSKTFTYTLAQQNDKQENVTYDNSTFTVNVTVTDDGTGALAAQVAFGDDEVPVFHNSYTKKIDMPTAATGLVYTGSEQVGVAEGEGYTLLGDAKATAAGSYEATAALAEGYAWSDGSTDAKTVTWSISEADPAYTVPAGLAATYGQVLSDVTLPAGFSWQDDPGTAVGAVGANTFKAKFTPADTANYNVVEGIDVVITVSPIKVAAPTAATGLIYTGSEQVGVAEGEGYTLSGDAKATAAGSYTATATLEEGYIWSDGTSGPKVIEWSIAAVPEPKPDPDPDPSPSPSPDDKGDADKGASGADGTANDPANSANNTTNTPASIAQTGDATPFMAIAGIAAAAAIIAATAAVIVYRRRNQ